MSISITPIVNSNGAQLLHLGVYDLPDLTTEIRDLARKTTKREGNKYVAWFGTKGLNYRYSNQDHIATGTPELIQELRTMAIQALQVAQLGDTVTPKTFNHILLNAYGKDNFMPLHTDSEPELSGSIVSISYGDTIKFHYTRQYRAEPQTLLVRSGSILVGNQKFFSTYWHGVSKPLNGKPRFNLTFRTIP